MMTLAALADAVEDGLKEHWPKTWHNSVLLIIPRIRLLSGRPAEVWIMLHVSKHVEAQPGPDTFSETAKTTDDLLTAFSLWLDDRAHSDPLSRISHSFDDFIKG